MGRFINADGLVATGQGFTGNNMFAYCCNNPVIAYDPIGNSPLTCAQKIIDAFKDITEEITTTVNNIINTHYQYKYITDQTANGIGQAALGQSTVAEGGCGVVATYNALITLGQPKTFSQVLSYYNNGHLVFDGHGGIFPGEVAKYFEQFGYTVIMANDWDAINIYSKYADACIMYYEWPNKNDIIPPYYAHFVSYQRLVTRYIGYNEWVGEKYSSFYFYYPSDWAYQGDRYHAVGIFIFK